MPDEKAIDRSEATFSQAEGLEPLPQPLKLGEVSDELRSLLWRAIYESMRKSRPLPQGGPGINAKVIGNWSFILYDHFTLVLHKFADEYHPDWEGNVDRVKKIVLEEKWNKLFDFLTFVLRHKKRPYQLEFAIGAAFKLAMAAYTTVHDPFVIVPAATEQEGDAIRLAFVKLADHGLDGARTHLADAATELNSGNYADSVAKSIHAVESVARSVEGKEKDTLGRILKAINDSTGIHQSLREGFVKIYGYTSDEKGIRHSLLKATAKVDLHDAVFMLGACASFVTYLIGKGREASIFKNE